MATHEHSTSNPICNRIEEVKQFDEMKFGVKGLIDSGITSIPRIFIHSPKTLQDLKPKTSTTQDPNDIIIPTIDFSSVDQANVVSKIREAAATWGFFHVTNHGIPQPVIDSTIQAVKSFHELSQEVKVKYYKRQERSGVLYSSNNDLYRSDAATWHDYLQVWTGPILPDPEEIPEVCRKEMVAWDMHVRTVCERVMELLCLGLGLEGDMFKRLSFSESRLLVGVFYPYCPQPELTMGLAGHTDPGALTILVQNGIGGLQVKHEEHGWVDVKPLHEGLLVNIGDFLQIISNGEYRSVQHRVLANSCKEPRISIVEFFNLTKWKGDGYYGPLPELLTKEKPAIYRDFTAEEFLGDFYGKGLDTKSLPEKLKIRN